MSNDEAKFILHAYRPSGRDANNPGMTAALAQAKSDPALGAWFAREQAHAGAMAKKLNEIMPPPGLREAILAGADATKRAAPKSTRWQAPAWFAIAACVALLVGASISFWPKSGAAADEMTAFAFDDVRHGQHGGHGVAAHTLQTELADPNTHFADGLLVDFSTLAKKGRRTLRVAGHDVIEVCFVRGGAEFHCYIGRSSDFPSRAETDGMTFVQRAGLTAATWSKAGQRFVVVSEAGLDAVKRLL
jgi:hypothetical protein